MNIKTILLTLLVSTSTLCATQVDPKLLHALHMVEASGRTGPILGDNGHALGPLQIHRGYFNDAAEFDPSLGHDYSKCSDLEFSKRVVTAYLNRFAPKAVQTNDLRTLARVHNGGPGGVKNDQTLVYWNKVKNNL